MDRPKTIDELIGAQLRDIKENRERYLKAWIAETGLKPSEAMQVTATLEDGSRVYWALKRGLPTDIDVLQREVRALRETIARVEFACEAYDKMPDGRGWAGVRPQSVAEAFRSVIAGALRGDAERGE